MDGQGNLYGTADIGGANNMGVIFKLAPDGTYTILHNFDGTDGSYPSRLTLLRDASGNLYGVTPNGGAFGDGTVFKLAPNGTFTVLHSFHGVDGVEPDGGLIMDDLGNLYGITLMGGSHNSGTVYEIKGAVSTP